MDAGAGAGAFSQPVPSSALFRWGLGTSPGWAVTHLFNRNLPQKEEEAATQPHCIFLVSRLSWKKTKKTQPGFLILTAQPSPAHACWSLGGRPAGNSQMHQGLAACGVQELVVLAGLCGRLFHRLGSGGLLFPRGAVLGR